MKPNCVSGGQHKFAENGERSEKQRRRGEPVGISVRIGESAVAQSERQQIRGGGSTAVAAGIAVTCRVGEECACGESGAGSRDSGVCVASEWEGWRERSCFDTQVRKELQQLPSRRWPKHRQFHHGQQCLDQLLWEQYGDIFTLLTKLCKFSVVVHRHVCGCISTSWRLWSFKLRWILKYVFIFWRIFSLKACTYKRLMVEHLGCRHIVLIIHVEKGLFAEFRNCIVIDSEETAVQCLSFEA
jgi:hypothetical protein